MNQLFLLKLIADLIKSDKPTVEEIRCARTIINSLIQNEPPILIPKGYEVLGNDLDEIAQQAKKELTS